jgi:ABC-type uncharacterized transport system substrate-binding protein
MGGLASYGAALPPMFRKAAQYVDKIFKGASPAELPVEQPVAFELALNLKTAAALDRLGSQYTKRERGRDHRVYAVAAGRQHLGADFSRLA